MRDNWVVDSIAGNCLGRARPKARHDVPRVSHGFTGTASNNSASKGLQRARKEIKKEISKWPKKAEAVE